MPYHTAFWLAGRRYNRDRARRDSTEPRGRTPSGPPPLGQLCFLDDGQTLAEALALAAPAFAARFGARPSACYVHPAVAAAAPAVIDGVRVEASPLALPGHFHLLLSAVDAERAKAARIAGGYALETAGDAELSAEEWVAAYCSHVAAAMGAEARGEEENRR